MVSAFKNLQDFQKIDPSLFGFDEDYVRDLGLAASQTDKILKQMHIYS